MSEQDMEHPAEDDRDDDELDGSPIPDPEESDSDTEDVPTAD
jgi:hypothetical protein